MSSSLVNRAKARALKIQKSLDSPHDLILPNFLYLGSDPRKTIGKKTDAVESYLQENSFTHRVDLTSNPIPSTNIPTFYLTVTDQPESTKTLFQQLENACNFIDTARKTSKAKILVHCKAGISRSATLVIYYLMTRAKMDLSLAKALRVVRDARPIVSPNEGFMRALCRIETEVLNKPLSIDPEAYSMHRMDHSSNYLIMK